MAGLIDEEFASKERDPKSITLRDVLSVYLRRCDYNDQAQALNPTVAPMRSPDVRDLRTQRGGRALAAVAYTGPPVAANARPRYESQQSSPARCTTCQMRGHDTHECFLRDDATWVSCPYYNGTTREEALSRRLARANRGPRTMRGNKAGEAIQPPRHDGSEEDPPEDEEAGTRRLHQQDAEGGTGNKRHCTRQAASLGTIPH
jgi:hypothetical protein